MAKFDFYGPFSGVKDGISLLTMLSDNEKLATVLEIANKLEGERNRLNKAIETYGKISQIEAILENANAKDRIAKKNLQESDKKINQDSAKFNQECKKIKDKLVYDKGQLTKRENEVKKQEADLKNHIQQQEEKFYETQRKLEQKERELHSQMSETTELKKRWEKAIADLKKQAAAV